MDDNERAIYEKMAAGDYHPSLDLPQEGEHEDISSSSDEEGSSSSSGAEAGAADSDDSVAQAYMDDGSYHQTSSSDSSSSEDEDEDESASASDSDSDGDGDGAEQAGQEPSAAHEMSGTSEEHGAEDAASPVAVIDESGPEDIEH
jgi:hypothetical protein